MSSLDDILITIIIPRTQHPFRAFNHPVPTIQGSILLGRIPNTSLPKRRLLRYTTDAFFIIAFRSSYVYCRFSVTTTTVVTDASTEIIYTLASLPGNVRTVRNTSPPV